MNNYDLTDLGYRYKGVATPNFKTLSLGPWEIIDIPDDVDKEQAEVEIKRFINKICALEIPTSLKCNLRCAYCYIDDPRMKNKNVSKSEIFNILEASSKLFPRFNKGNVSSNNKVYISPWGAEPFMNIDTLETTYEFFHETYGKDNYILGTSTNGTIWSDRISKFFINLVEDNALNQLQISLDGPPNVHDRFRKYSNGNGSFEDVENFTSKFTSLMNDLGVNKKVEHFCSTIHLIDEHFPEIWRDTADFFSTPGKWYTSLPFLPMRMSGENMDNKAEINRFIKAQEMILELAKEKQKEGILFVDFYTAKLFGELSCKSKNAFPYCSAMNTQIGIDIDGSIYPCHGAITSPTYKPYMWIGNIYDKVLSYQKIIRNIHYQFGSIWTRSKCTECPLYKLTTGNICWSCAPHNLAMTGNPSIDNVNKCIAYGESFKYWAQIAKMNINNDILNDIDGNSWFGEGINTIKKSNNCININDKKKDMHFDKNFDGFIMKSIDKFTGNLPNNNIQYEDTWWKMDNYIMDNKRG